MTTEPAPISDFVKRCRELVDKIVASEDTNERRMLEQQLKALLMPKPKGR